MNDQRKHQRTILGMDPFHSARMDPLRLTTPLAAAIMERCSAGVAEGDFICVLMTSSGMVMYAVKAPAKSPAVAVSQAPRGAGGGGEAPLGKVGNANLVACP